MSSIRSSLINLYKEEFTGKVVLEREKIRKVIYFRRGNPMYVESTIRSETLGQLLLSHGQLTEEQYAKVLEAMKASGKRQGEVIVELGFLSGYEVFEAMRGQMASKLQNAFLLDGAKATISQGDKELEGIQEFPIDFLRVLIDATDTSLEDDLQGILPEEKALTLTPEARKTLGNQTLKPFEIRAVRRLNGRFTIAQIIQEAGIDEDNVLNFLLTLKTLNFLEIREAPPKRFQVRADEVHKEASALPEEEKPEEGRKTIELELGESRRETPKKKPPAHKDSPIYHVALQLDHPYHQILDVQSSTPKFQIQKNYDLLVRRLHLQEPENHYEGKELELALRILDRITTAYTVLSNDTQRKKYFKNFQDRKEHRISPEIQAEVHFQKGQVALKSNRFDSAIEEIRKAVELCPKEPAYHIGLADVLLRKTATEKSEPSQEIETHLKEALKIDQGQFSAWYQMGLLSKFKGEFERAVGCFQKTVDIKTNHPEASAELRILRKRLEDKKGQSSLLNIFKKK